MNRLTKKDYVRPDVTLTDKLSKQDIEDKLADYTVVTDMYKVPLGTHLRYFSLVNGVKKFRLGGNLIKNSGLPDYVILSNGIKSWSVQTKNTTFFRRMNINEIKKEYEDIIDNLEYKNKTLRSLIVHLKQEIKD